VCLRSVLQIVVLADNHRLGVFEARATNCSALLIAIGSECLRSVLQIVVLADSYRLGVFEVRGTNCSALLIAIG